MGPGRGKRAEWERGWWERDCWERGVPYGRGLARSEWQAGWHVALSPHSAAAPSTFLPHFLLPLLNTATPPCYLPPPTPQELAFARKYPSKPPRDWVKKSQKYRAPGGAVTHAVPLADMVSE